MKILVDTNILISAALFPNSIPFKAYVKAVSFPHHAVVCEQNIDEMKRVFYRKFPARIEALDRFLAAALLVLDVVPVRDCLDRPIPRAAIQADVDILLTGDKEDFLESGIRAPRIMTPAQFMNL